MLTGVRVSAWGDETVLETDSDGDCRTLNVIHATELYLHYKMEKWLRWQTLLSQ